jgi:hypothetical protein
LHRRAQGCDVAEAEMVQRSTTRQDGQLFARLDVQVEQSGVQWRKVENSGSWRGD